MKILKTNLIKELDKYTIENEPISSIDLMERASIKVFNKIKDLGNEYYIFAGNGNNGGDGLAIARLLFEHKKNVKVFVFEGDKSIDNEINYKRLISVLPESIYILKSAANFPKFYNEIIIDAVFGSGLNNELSGIYLETIKHINNSKCQVISIDIPSGLMGENNSYSNINGIIKANKTFTFQFPKLSFMFPENFKFVGDFEILDINLSEKYIKELHTHYYYITENFVIKNIKKRNKFAHKGSYGHALLIAGSKNMTGAAILSAKACMRSGCGLLTCYVPTTVANVLQVSLPEAIVLFDKSKLKNGDLLKKVNYSSIGIGPGLGVSNKTKKILKSILLEFKKPIVLDADALNIISNNKSLLKLIPEGSILTPHLGEFTRLFGMFESDYLRMEFMQTFSKETKLIIVLKGAHTCISLPNGDIYFNSTGNPGMSTAGSGDVLTGIILGLLSQSYSSEMAAIIGVYIHGKAGDLASEERDEYSIIASDIIDKIKFSNR